MYIGTRIPHIQKTPSPPLGAGPLTNSSTNVFTSKHCVSKEHLSTTDMECMYICL